MSIARVETPSACSSNSSPGNRADASFSVAPQLRIDLRSTRMYSLASAAAIATATVPLFTSDTDQGGLACAPSSHAASGVPRRDRSSAHLRLRRRERRDRSEADVTATDARGRRRKSTCASVKTREMASGSLASGRSSLPVPAGSACERRVRLAGGERGPEEREEEWRRLAVEGVV